MACARCHDHKFDPLGQKEFYQVFAYFNNVPERGKAIKFGNSPPYIPTPTPAQQEQFAALDRGTGSGIDSGNPPLPNRVSTWASPGPTQLT